MKAFALAFGIIVTVALLAFGGYAVYDELTPEPVVGKVTQIRYKPVTPEDLLKEVNEERAKVGVAPMVLDSRLNASALQKAQDLQADNYIEHVNPRTGVNGLDYIDKQDIRCKTIGENLHRNPNPALTASMAISGLKLSEPHYKAMINPNYDLTGFARIGPYVVEHFCDMR